MGSHPNVTADRMPKRGSLHARLMTVVFNYDDTKRFRAVCVRNDAEEPYVTAFMLEDGRLVLSSECQYQPEKT